MFPAKRIRKNSEYAPFFIPGASTETENDLRVKLIVERKIGFLLELIRPLIK